MYPRRYVIESNSIKSITNDGNADLVPPILNLFRQDKEGTNINGLANKAILPIGDNNHFESDQKISSHNNSLRYFVNIPHYTSDFDFLKNIFIESVKKSANTNGFHGRTINRAVSRTELLDKYSVFYIDFIGNNALGQGLTDFFIVCFDSDGKRIDQNKVAFIRDSRGSGIIVLIDDKTCGSLKNIFIIPKSYFGEINSYSNSITLNLTNENSRYYTATTTIDENNSNDYYLDESFFDVLLNLKDSSGSTSKIIVDPSLYNLKITKSAAANTMDGKIQLVGRRNQYNKDTYRGDAATNKNTTGNNPKINRYTFEITLYINPDSSLISDGNIYLIPKQNLVDTFSGLGIPVNGTYNNSIMSAGGFYFRDGRRRFSFKISGADLKNIKTLSPNDLIASIETAGKIITQSVRDNSKAEIEIYKYEDNTWKLVCTESTLPYQSFGGDVYYFYYTYGPEIKARSGSSVSNEKSKNYVYEKYPNSDGETYSVSDELFDLDLKSNNALEATTTNSSVSITIMPIENSPLAIHDEKIIHNNPQAFSFNNAGEPKIRDIILYNKNIYNDKILANEPYFEIVKPDDNIENWYFKINGRDPKDDLDYLKDEIDSVYSGIDSLKENLKTTIENQSTLYSMYREIFTESWIKTISVSGGYQEISTDAYSPFYMIKLSDTDKDVEIKISIDYGKLTSYIYGKNFIYWQPPFNFEKNNTITFEITNPSDNSILIESISYI